MIQKLLSFIGPTVAIVLVLCSLSSCSKEKEAVPETPPTEEAATTPKLELKEPATATEDVAKPAVAAAPPVPAGAISFEGRLESFVRRASRSLWQTVNTTAEPQQYALITPKSGSGDLSKLVTAGGPDNLALGLDDKSLRTADGKVAVVGQNYRFTLTAGGAENDWTVEITPAP